MARYLVEVLLFDFGTFLFDCQCFHVDFMEIGMRSHNQINGLLYLDYGF